MRHLFLCLLITLVTFGLSINEASAKRFGGAGGFGMMRSKHLFSQSSTRAKKPSAVINSMQSNRWRGALSGLLLGSLLTSMFMGHGFSSALISWFIIGTIIYLIINFIRRKSSVNLQ